MNKKEVADLILYDKDKKILLQHRDKDTKILPDHWDAFGGKIENGETPEQAMRREIQEELEYAVESPSHFRTTAYTDGAMQFTVHTFIEKYDSSKPLILHEGQGMGWFTTDEALGLKMANECKQIILDIKKYLDTL
jgi:8-oxo-dGTP diphosphatase